MLERDLSDCICFSWRERREAEGAGEGADMVAAAVGWWWWW